MISRDRKKLPTPQSGSRAQTCREARREAARWRTLRSYLQDPEWPPWDAAYLLVGLDPYWTQYSEQQGWWFFWLPGCPEGGLDGDRLSLEENTRMSLDRMSWLTSSADPMNVRTPHEWIEWSVRARCEPPWLKLAYSRPSVVSLLPSKLHARKDAPAVPRRFHSQISALGGQARHAKSPGGKAKVFVRERYDDWAKKPTGSASAFAVKIYEELRRHAERFRDREKAPYVELSTIQTWVRSWERERAKDAISVAAKKQP